MTKRKAVVSLTLLLFLLFSVSAFAEFEPPTSLQLVSVDNLISQNDELNENERKILHECLSRIKGRFWVESKEYPKSEEALLSCLNSMRPFAEKAAFSIPILSWLFVRDDGVLQIGKDLIKRMGGAAIPYLEGSTRSQYALISVGALGLLVEIDRERSDKHLKELIKKCSSVTAKERLAAFKALSRINEDSEVIVETALNLSGDKEKEIRDLALRSLSTRLWEFKDLINKHLYDSKSSVTKKAYLASLMWTQAMAEEQAKLEDLLDNLKPENDTDRAALVEVSSQLRMFKEPSQEGDLFKELSSPDFLSGDWKRFVQSHITSQQLVSVAMEDRSFGGINAVLLLYLRKDRNPLQLTRLKEALSGRNEKLVEHAVKVLDIMVSETSAPVIHIESSFGRDTYSSLPYGEGYWETIHTDYINKPDYSFLLPLADYVAGVLGHKDEIASKAIRILKVFGQDGIRAIEGRLNDRNLLIAVRAHGIMISSPDVHNKTPHFQYIRKALSSRNRWVGHAIVDAVIGAELDSERIPILIEALNFSGGSVAVRAGAFLHSEGERAVPYLREALNHKNPLVVAKVMGLIARQTGEIDQYLPALQKAFQRGNAQTKKAVCRVAEDLTDRGIPLAPVIIGGLGGDRDTSFKCMMAFEYMGAGTVPALKEYGITHSSWKVVLISHYLLVRFGADQKKHLQPLIDAVKSGNPQKSAVAVIHLTRLGSLGEPAVKSLIDAVPSARGRALADIVYAVSEIAPRKKATMELFRRGLRSPDANFREIAIVCIGMCGSEAEQDLPMLEKLRDSDPSPEIRRFAEHAIKNIKKGF